VLRPNQKSRPKLQRKQRREWDEAIVDLLAKKKKSFVIEGTSPKCTKGKGNV
jgi:hypothetical protein